MPPPQKMFSILSLKMATFSAFWALAHVSRGHAPPLGSASVHEQLCIRLLMHRFYVKAAYNKLWHRSLYYGRTGCVVSIG